MSTFPKKYDHTIEQSLYEQRELQGCFSPERVVAMRTDMLEEKFTISLPPPNVTWVLHLWHALMLAVEDTMVRYHRMKWYETLWVPGTDHAGIATQVVVERQLQEDGVSKFDLWREKFLWKVWDWVHYSRSTIIWQTKRLGASVDWQRLQFTMSESLSRAVRKAFKNLYETGKIYKDTYMVNRSPWAQTVLSDLEVDYKEEPWKMYYIRYFVEGKWDNITIATVRPETIFADVAIAVHPKDRRYKKRIWRNVLIPLVNRPIPIVADERVAIDFGTWALKITPAHAEMDFAIAKDHNLPLDVFAFDKDNIFTSYAWEAFVWRNVDEYYENLIQYLTEIGNVAKAEDHVSSIPYCSRTWTRVQPMLSTQWFMNVKPASEHVMNAVQEQRVHVHPKRFENTFVSWLEDIRPWCISRQLRRWHRIPVWYDQEGNNYVWDEDSVLSSKKWTTTILSLIIFNLIADSRLPVTFNTEQLIELLCSTSANPEDGYVWQVFLQHYTHKFAWNKTKQKEITTLHDIFTSVDEENVNQLIRVWEKLIDILDKATQIISDWDGYAFVFCHEGIPIEVTQEEDVLDTRFSSGLWPFSILWWPDNTKDLEKYYPNTVLETGYDIIFFWVIRMMLMWVEMTDTLPFEHVYLHGLVRDQQGKKMSKSKWNVIDPLKLIDQYGSDALRWALLLGNTPGNDQKFSEDKVEYVRRFINKLWNASRFVLLQIVGSDTLSESISYQALEEELFDKLDVLNEYDRWIVWKIQEKLIQIDKYNAKFMLGEALQESLDLVWHDFCDWYIEIVKIETSTYSNKVLLYALWSFYKILHPYIPFVTEKLRQLLGFDGILMVSAFPKQQNITAHKNYRMHLLMEMISEWRNLKKQVTDKPHEKVSLFVQANKDIQLLVEDHSSLVKNIIRVDDIEYINDHQEAPEGYQVAMIMDIKVWAKWIKEISWKEVLSDLEKQKEDEEQFLQRLRITLASPDFAMKAPEQVVSAKKQKMQEVKRRIAQIDFEINKIKMQKKS